MKVVEVNRKEYKLSDGSIHPIIPELEFDITVEEFNKLYEQSDNIIKSLETIRSNNPDS